jgi:hypothetical protein
MGADAGAQVADTQSGLAHPAIRKFWGTTVRSFRDKDRVIELYELTSIDRLTAEEIRRNCSTSWISITV